MAGNACVIDRSGRHRGLAFVEKTQTSLLGQLPLDDRDDRRVRRTDVCKCTELYPNRFGMVKKYSPEPELLAGKGEGKSKSVSFLSPVGPERRGAYLGPPRVGARRVAGSA